MKLTELLLILAVSSGLTGSASASLIDNGFLSGGSGQLILDTSTGLEWLVPSYTAGHNYDDSFVQNIISTYGFQYATEAQTENMINSNFNNPPTVSPGTAAGAADAQAFFNVFGINDVVYCQYNNTFAPCPRTQGFTSTSSSPGTQDAVGMFVLQGDGYLIENNPVMDNINGETQFGSWLVLNTNQAISPTPEPGSLYLFGTGILTLGALARKRLA